MLEQSAIICIYLCLLVITRCNELRRVQEANHTDRSTGRNITY